MEFRMSKLPSAKTKGLIAIEVANEFVVQDMDGREMARLDRLEGQIWHFANGHRSVHEIIELLHMDMGGVPLNAETVWSVLDRLADLDLLTDRVTPPVLGRSLSRRGILRVAGVVVGASAAAGSTAFGQDRGELSSRESSTKENAGKRNAQQESNQKRANQQESSNKQQESSNKRNAQEGAGKRMQEEVTKSRK
jgi:hypothetical protein